MKKLQVDILTLCVLVANCLLPISSLFSQAPQGLNYQAVVRNSGGDILQSRHISLRFTITDENGGPVLYQEIQNPTSNEFGLITLSVGNGVPISGTFSGIDWPKVSPWLQVEMDVEGGTSYEIMGTSRLLSVPYALFAANSGGESVWDTSGSDIFFNNYVGIGTNAPSAPLTIQTGVDEVGFSHLAGVNPITLSTSISDVSASIGTTSDHPFSLTSGGTGKVHILTDGRVILGNDADPLNFAGSNETRSTPLVAKLNLETAINSIGWLHVGGADSIIVAEAIGGISAAIGTTTNHTFRLNSNGLGRIHLLPDGNVVVGNNVQGPVGIFTVHTLNNSYGMSQVGGDGQIIATRIGGSSAGIGTFTNHIMRIFANGISAINIDGAGSVAIGTPDPLPGYKLSVNGNIKSKELVIETVGWPDYVFHADYKLSSLHDLETYIHEHKHLPNIPAATEIEEHGLPVGDVQKRMMEKIEELTLHIIALNKRIESLENHHRP